MNFIDAHDFRSFSYCGFAHPDVDLLRLAQGAPEAVVSNA